MSKENVPELLKLGFTEGEAKVYLTLLELGSSTAGPLVKKSNVAYSNIYDVLQRLIDKGIVSYVIKSKTRYYQAADPTNLYQFIERKEEEIAVQKQTLAKIIPILEKVKDLKPQQEVEIFLGKKGLRTAYEKLLANGEDNLFFYLHDKEYAKASDLFYFSIQDMLKKNPTKGISNKKYEKSTFIKQAKYIKIRYVDFPIPGNIEICGDKVMMVSWKAPMMAVLTQSASIAENLRKYFNVVWEEAKPR